MSYTLYEDGAATYFPRPNKRVTARLLKALQEFRIQEFESGVHFPGRTLDVIDAFEVLLEDMKPQARGLDDGRDYERLGPDGERL